MATPRKNPDGTYGTVPLSKPKTEPEPLPEVEVTPLPKQPYYYPFKTVREYVNALKGDIERLTIELQHRQLSEGKEPVTLTWWKYAAAGLGAGLLGFYSRGCL